VLICITPKSSDPSVLRWIVPGAPPSTAWIAGSTRGGRWLMPAMKAMQAR
jgi:hypothetical protein